RHIDHPRPSTTSAIGVVTALVGSWEAAMNPSTAEAASTAIPAAAIRTPPHRSTIHPNTGLNAYIPSVCREMTTPTNANVMPWWVMCSGVMTITMTMTAWATAVTTTA